jgi:hypothetical protein
MSEPTMKDRGSSPGWCGIAARPAGWFHRRLDNASRGPSLFLRAHAGRKEDSMSVYLNPTDLITLWNLAMVAILAVHIQAKKGGAG